MGNDKVKFFIYGMLVALFIVVVAGCNPNPDAPTDLEEVEYNLDLEFQNVRSEIQDLKDNCPCPKCGHEDGHANFFASMPCLCGASCVFDCTCDF